MVLQLSGYNFSKNILFRYFLGFSIASKRQAVDTTEDARTQTLGPDHHQDELPYGEVEEAEVVEAETVEAEMAVDDDETMEASQ